MAGKAEIFVGVLNDGVVIGAGAASISDQFTTGNSGMTLLSQSGQTGAVLADVTAITSLAGPYAPIVSLPANVIAGTITFMKISMDLRDGQQLNDSDVVSLVGNTAGAIATMAVLAGAGAASVGVLTGISIGAGLYTIYNSDAMAALTMKASEFFKADVSGQTSDYSFAPDMSIVSNQDIVSKYNNRAMSLNWDVDTDKVSYSNVRGPSVGWAPPFEDDLLPSFPPLPVPDAPEEDWNIDISFGDKLCFDSDSYVGGGEALAFDPVGCLVVGSDGYSITIDYSLESELTWDDRANIIFADPTNSFYLCK